MNRPEFNDADVGPYFEGPYPLDFETWLRVQPLLVVPGTVMAILANRHRLRCRHNLVVHGGTWPARTISRSKYFTKHEIRILLDADAMKSGETTFVMSYSVMKNILNISRRQLEYREIRKFDANDISTYQTVFDEVERQVKRYLVNGKP